MFSDWQDRHRDKLFENECGTDTLSMYDINVIQIYSIYCQESRNFFKEYSMYITRLIKEKEAVLRKKFNRKSSDK